MIYSRRFLEFCQPRPQSALVLFTLLVVCSRSSRIFVPIRLPFVSFRFLSFRFVSFLFTRFRGSPPARPPFISSTTSSLATVSSFPFFLFPIFEKSRFLHFHRSIRRDPSSSRERTRRRERVAPSHVDWPAPRIYKIRHDRAIHSILAKLSIPIVRGRSYIAAGADFEFRPATLARNSSRNWDRDRIFYSRNDDDTHEISIATLLFDFIAPVRRRRSDSRQSSSPRSHGTQWRHRFSVQPRKTSANFDDVVSSSFRFQSLHTRSQSSVHIYFQNGIQIYIYIFWSGIGNENGSLEKIRMPNLEGKSSPRPNQNPRIVGQPAICPSPNAGQRCNTPILFHVCS